MQELSNTAWCPVLSEAPFAGLPWPASTERVAPPRGSRPLPEAWLCSSSLRLLSTECRHAPAHMYNSISNSQAGANGVCNAGLCIAHNLVISLVGAAVL